MLKGYQRCHYSNLHFEAVVFAPFLHHLDEVLNLRVVCVLQHLNYFNQSLVALFAGDNHLKNTDGGSSLTLPEFWIRVESLKNVESFG